MGELLVLRVVHVLGGIFWVGSMIFNTFFLMPALAAVGPAAGQVMAGLQQRRLFTAIPVVAVLTILSGLRLMWITSAGFVDGYLASARGATFAISGVLAVIAFFIGILVLRPAALRAGALGAQLASAATPEARAELGAQLAKLRQRSAQVSTILVWLLLLSAVGMAVGRYLV